jgi:hypothetical protein
MKNNLQTAKKIFFAVLILHLTLGFDSLIQARTTVTLTDKLVTVSSYSESEIIINGQTDLHLTSSTPLINSIVDLNSVDSWLFIDNKRPSVVVDSLLQYVYVNGQLAVNNTNVRVSMYRQGTVIIPHTTGYSPLTVYTDQKYGGSSQQYTTNTYFNALGSMNDSIRSFKLKRGYMATLAANADGSGMSQVFIADNNDLEVPIMPSALDQKTSFIRVFKWNYTGKKGICGTDQKMVNSTNSSWCYDWGASTTYSQTNSAYEPMRAKLNWPYFSAINAVQNSNHVLGLNEPDHPEQHKDDNGGNAVTVDQALSQWPNMFASGLRIGSPACTSSSWIYNFIDSCDARGYRVDYVAWHAYWGGKTTTSWYNDLKNIYLRTKRPLWITEWNNGANWTTESWPGGDPVIYANDANVNKQLTNITAIMNVLDTASFVERYSIYNWVGYARAMTITIDSAFMASNPDYASYTWLKTAPVINVVTGKLLDGTTGSVNVVLTPAGQYYAGFNSKISFNHDNEVKPVDPDNIVNHWAGYGIIGTNSAANKSGWTCSYSGATWGTANGSGVRYMDVNSTSSPVHYRSDGTTVYSGREFLYRWDGSYWGSTLTLGKYPGYNKTGVPPLAMKENATYQLSGLFEWWANGSKPTYSFSISTDSVGGTIVASGSFTYPSTTKNRLQPFSMSFVCPATGNYYIQIKQTSGTSSSNGTIIGLADITLHQLTFPAVNISTGYIKLSDTLYTQKVFVSGNTLNHDIILSAPAGITLSKSIIPVAETQAGDSILITYDKATLITDTIRIASGSLSKNLAVYASPIVVNGVSDGGFELASNNGVPLGTWVNDRNVSLGSGLKSRVISNGYQCTGYNSFLLRFQGDTYSYNYIGTKVTGLIPGATYRFDFNYKQAGSNASLAQMNVYAVAGGIADSTSAIDGAMFKTTAPSDITTAQPTSSGALTFMAPSESCYIVFEKTTAFSGINFFIYLDDMKLTKTADANLIKTWNGNGITSDNSESNKWGWASTHASASWGMANTSGGVRFMDLSASSSPVHYQSDGTTVFAGREMLYRWDGGYWGSTLSLGTGSGANTTVTPISLIANGTYTLSGKYEWWANGNLPTYTFGVSTAQSGGTVIALDTVAYPISTKNRLQPFSLTFTCPSTGDYYIQAKQINGTSSANGTIIGLADLSLMRVYAQTRSAISSEQASPSILNPNQNESIRTFVNHGNISINIEASKSDIALISVYSIQGNMVANDNLMIKEGINTYETRSFLPNGLYIIKIKINNSIYIQKIIK